jgi:CheY-like chemotaxis protein
MCPGVLEHALFELVRRAKFKRGPDRIIMDLGLPGASGFEGVRMLKEYPATRLNDFSATLYL